MAETEQIDIDVVLGASKAAKILDQLPPEVKKWAEALPWSERQYVLSLCHLLIASPPEVQAEFLDEYTADGLLSKVILDQDAQEKIRLYLSKFHIKTKLKGKVLRKYIKQFYLHSSQDTRRQPEKYLESALRLVFNQQEKNDILNYILGFEIIKMIFQMSWQQQERLYKLQINQDYFYNKYIKPVQYTHRTHNIISPKDEKVFFAKRDYFVQIPTIPEKKLTKLIVVTFSTEDVIELGFSVSRNAKYLIFDYEYIYQPEEDEKMFSQ